jgi:hypothetical protein
MAARRRLESAATSAAERRAKGEAAPAMRGGDVRTPPLPTLSLSPPLSLCLSLRLPLRLTVSPTVSHCVSLTVSPHTVSVSGGGHAPQGRGGRGGRRRGQPRRAAAAGAAGVDGEAAAAPAPPATPATAAPCACVPARGPAGGVPRAAAAARGAGAGAQWLGRPRRRRLRLGSAYWDKVRATDQGGN